MPGSQPSRRDRSDSVIWSAVMVSSDIVLLAGFNDLAQRVDPAGDRAVDHGVADPGNDPTDDGWIDNDLDLETLPGGVTEGLDQPFDGGLVERNCGPDLGDCPVP